MRGGEEFKEDWLFNRMKIDYNKRLVKERERPARRLWRNSSIMRVVAGRAGWNRTERI